MEGRVHNEYEGIETPIGIIPKYEDINALFKQIFDKEYTREEYEEQFSIRIIKLLERLDRIEAITKDPRYILFFFVDGLNPIKPF